MTPISLQRRLEPVVQRALLRLRRRPSRPGGLPRFLQDAAPEGAPGDAGVTDAGPAPTDAGGGLPGGVPAPPLPAGPDACGTVEEEERKTKFRARSFSALNFRPSAGYGQFDAYYWPASSLMAAIVKMKFNFVEADNTPPAATLWWMWIPGQDISQFFWTDAQKDQFAEEYRNRVAARWSFAHTFRSKKPCWPFTARPYVAPRVVGDAGGRALRRHGAQSPGPGHRKSGFRARIPAPRAGEGPASSMSRMTGGAELQQCERGAIGASAARAGDCRRDGVAHPLQKDSAVIQPGSGDSADAGRRDEGQESLGPGDTHQHQRVREQRRSGAPERKAGGRPRQCRGRRTAAQPGCRSRW